jgi:hypothetical protein
MFFYLIHSLPHSAELDEGKRNVRTIFLGIILYVIFHGILFTNYMKGKLKYLSLLKPYFYYILGADILTMNMLYKINYGKWLFSELDFGLNNSSHAINMDDPRNVYNQQMMQQIPQTEYADIPEYIPEEHNESENKELKNKELKNKELTNKELKNKELKNKELKNKELKNKESKHKESENKEATKKSNKKEIKKNSNKKTKQKSDDSEEISQIKNSKVKESKYKSKFTKSSKNGGKKVSKK